MTITVDINGKPTEITLTEEQIKQCKEQKFKYPLFKRSKLNGTIVKFTNLNKGIIVWKDKNTFEIGYTSCNWVEHTNSIWEDVAYDKNRDLWDGQPIYCWCNDTHSRLIRFYDAKNKCVFAFNGERRISVYTNIEAIKPEHYTEWMIKAFETLEK